MESLEEIGKKVKSTTGRLNSMSTKEKNDVLRKVAEAVVNHGDEILQANKKDVEKAIENGMKESLVDRLRLDEKRNFDMAEGLRKIADLEDPIGETIEGKVLENGLEISVPLFVNIGDKIRIDTRTGLYMERI